VSFVAYEAGDFEVEAVTRPLQHCQSNLERGRRRGNCDRDDARSNNRREFPLPDAHKAEFKVREDFFLTHFAGSPITVELAMEGFAVVLDRDWPTGKFEQDVDLLVGIPTPEPFLLLRSERMAIGVQVWYAVRQPRVPVMPEPDADRMKQLGGKPSLDAGSL
jgi:hypothetical protein